MNRQIIVEDTVGETRAGVVENGRLVELHVERWSEVETRAVEGEIYRGRVRAVDTALNAAFIDIGVGPDGFLPFGKAGRPKGFHEGAAIGVKIVREAQAEKGPNLARAEVDEGEAPECLTPAAPLAQRLVASFGDADAIWSDESAIDLAGAFEDALQPHVPIPGGGSLYIEPTRAMTTIDVDADGRKGQGNTLKLIESLNVSAAKEAARQVRLRGLGGIVAIDFVQMRQIPLRKTVEQALRGGFRGDRAKVDVAPLSQFCVGELARQKRQRSLREIYLDDTGRFSVETCAIAALRRLEAEGRADRRRRLTLAVSPEVSDWLNAAQIDWRGALTERLGPRFEIESRADWSRDRCEVSTS